MDYAVSQNGAETIVSLSGNIGFTDHPIFKRAVEEVAEQKASRVIVELNKVDAIDSAGLSMFLIMQDKVRKFGGEVILRGARDNVERVFDVVNFSALFTIEKA